MESNVWGGLYREGVRFPSNTVQTFTPLKKKKKDKKLLSFVKKCSIGSKKFETGIKTFLRIKLIQ